jgi:hypothetical protein
MGQDTQKVGCIGALGPRDEAKIRECPFEERPLRGAIDDEGRRLRFFRSPDDDDGMIEGRILGFIIGESQGHQ